MEKAFRYGDVCEYIEYVVPYRQYGVVLGLGVGLGQTTTHTVKIQQVTNYYTGPLTLTDSLE
jgi:hypothetical protein